MAEEPSGLYGYAVEVMAEMPLGVQVSSCSCRFMIRARLHFAACGSNLSEHGYLERGINWPS